MEQEVEREGTFFQVEGLYEELVFANASNKR
jgi:hypothetical protein